MLQDTCIGHTDVINCNVITNAAITLNCFPFDLGGQCKVIKDNVYNNIVVTFPVGSPVECDYFDHRTLSILCELYKYLVTLTDYNSIHIIGHSMGGSIAILFTYLIMIIEKIKLSHDLSILTTAPFDLNPNKISESIWYVSQFGIDEHDVDIFRSLKEENRRLNSKYIRDTIVITPGKTINQHIKILISGAFPVLFRAPFLTEQQQSNPDIKAKAEFEIRQSMTEIKNFLDFYNNRFIHLVNVITIDGRNYIDNMSLDTIFPTSILSNYILTDINNFDSININAISGKNSPMDDNNATVHAMFNPPINHMYKTYRDKLKLLHVKIDGRAETQISINGLGGGKRKSKRIRKSKKSKKSRRMRTTKRQKRHTRTHSK